MEIHGAVDAVIIGGGTAGLRAGAELAGRGCSSLILSKGEPCRGIVGLNALLEEAGDTRDRFLGDTLRAAAGIGDESLAANLIDNSRRELEYLEGLGLGFLHEGLYRPRKTSGNSLARTVYTTDTTGEEIISALTAVYIGGGGRIEKRCRAAAIVQLGGRVAGILAVDSHSGRYHLYPCKAIAAATGGLGNLYTRSTNGSSLSGDGLVMALDAGASLRDMEFVQFEPFALLLPGVRQFFSLSFLLEDNPRICCERGRPIFSDGEVETLSKAEISRKLYQRISELRNEGLEGRLFFDCTRIPESKLRLHGKLAGLCRKAGYLLENDPLPFTPAQHYLLGGITVNSRYETDVHGLFAAGEAVGGTHGADRLAGNSATDTLVSGHLAAASLHRYLTEAWQAPEGGGSGAALTAAAEDAANRIQRFGLSMPEPLDVESLRNVMWDDAGISRSEESLLRAKKGIESLKERQRDGRKADAGVPGGAALSWRNQLAAAEMIVQSALMREESRGVHYRSDVPASVESLKRSIMIRKEQGRAVCRFA